MNRLFQYIWRRISPIKYWRFKGVEIGEGCRFVGDIYFGSEPYLVSLGNHVSVTSSTFVTHDGGVWVLRDEYPEVDVINGIVVGNNVYIGKACIILPGVRIGSNVVIGAGSVVTKSLGANAVYAGVPARYIRSIGEYAANCLEISVPTKNMTSIEKRKFLLEKANSK